ncbi:MAG TPA: hypothetical protein VHR66_06170 [Gemmataceae bacterium]|jgi:hypothetical protein|nr:hypothetical protein [Gemmataceae bacterium]
MSRRSLALGVVAVICLTGFIDGQTGVAQPPGSPLVEQPFTGKFIVVVKKSNPASSIDLMKVEVRRLEGRSFLVGIGADTPDNWQKGKTVWLALDDVSEVTTFDTLEELRKASQMQDGPKGEGPPKKDGQ